MTNKLSSKQKLFCDEYLKTGNATKSAIAAGYSEKYAHTNASKLLQNTTIKDYISEQLKSIESEKIADASEVLAFYTSVMRDKGNDLKDRIAAASQLLKRTPTTLEEAKIKQLDVNTRLLEVKYKEAAKGQPTQQSKLDKLLKKMTTDDLRKLARMSDDR